MPEGLLLVTETNLGVILEHIAALKPSVVIVDSIQTTYMPELESGAGSVDVAFSPDGTRLASSWGGITTIHVLPLDELVEQVHSRLIRPMTPEECLTYLHESTCPAWP